jgi:hypothetical protein
MSLLIIKMTYSLLDLDSWTRIRAYRENAEDIGLSEDCE